MMGGHHAMTGAAAWIAVTATGHGFGWYDVDPLGTITGALLCAGAAMLPDADHSSATIAHSVPFVGRAVTEGISKASGGHRHGLHALLAVICAWFLAVGLGWITWQPSWWHQPVAVGPAIMTAASVTFAMKALKVAKTWPQAWLGGFAIAAFVALFAPEQQSWFALCFTIGYGVHLAGDFLTTGGLPLFWPWVPKPPKSWREIPVLKNMWTSGGYWALPVLGNAGSIREWLLLIPISAYVGYGILYAIVAMFGIDLTAVMTEVWQAR
ncbi:metal-dependent hydrolase [Agromyces humi]|uniref:metal-dependent hydrolase n=1 Tax=Agromyces humi TaxID=1766800 RepID=UPI00135A35C8|nr:metal-dependent hydrolase [Agromyces humi]